MDGRGAPCRRRRRRALDRTLIAAAALAAAVTLQAAPLDVHAAASPTPVPSPALNDLLAQPPSSDFIEDTESTGTPVGPFTRDEYVEFVGPRDPAATQKALHDDGFVAGFGRSWTAASTNVGLVELVIAFAGGRGARRWLYTAEAVARSSTFYKGPITVDGIGAYYGVRYADPSTPSFAQVVSFVKGNDYFLIGFVSGADDLGDAAATQSRRQYQFAAADSIRPAAWPENAQAPLFGLTPERLPIVVLVAGLAVAALVGVAVGLVLVTAARRRRRPPAQPTSGL